MARVEEAFWRGTLISYMQRPTPQEGWHITTDKTQTNWEDEAALDWAGPTTSPYDDSVRWEAEPQAPLEGEPYKIAVHDPPPPRVVLDAEAVEARRHSPKGGLAPLPPDRATTAPPACVPREHCVVDAATSCEGEGEAAPKAAPSDAELKELLRQRKVQARIGVMEEEEAARRRIAKRQVQTGEEPTFEMHGNALSQRAALLGATASGVEVIKEEVKAPQYLMDLGIANTDRVMEAFSQLISEKLVRIKTKDGFLGEDSAYR